MKDQGEDSKAVDSETVDSKAVDSKTASLKTRAEVKKPSLFKRIEAGLHEYYVTPYRRSFARAQRDEDDLFMLLMFAENLGVPNPAAYYTMELLPVIYDRFHDWHTRMGMERSPLDHISCC